MIIKNNTEFITNLNTKITKKQEELNKDLISVTAGEWNSFFSILEQALTKEELTETVEEANSIKTCIIEGLDK